MPTRRLDFTDHRRELGNNRYVYAVVSRRARGLSVGINLNPDKVCNFDCPYCQVDRTTGVGSAVVDVAELRAELIHLLRLVHGGQLWTTPPFDTTEPDLRRVADIAFAGDGEPTTPPEFPAAVQVVRECRDLLAPTVPIRLLTNATMVHRPRVRNALADIDEAWCKLDAGTAEYFATVDGTKFPFSHVLRNLSALASARPIVIQSMFMSMDGQAAPDAEIGAWVARLVEISQVGRISEVQVYTVARKPSNPRVGPISTERLTFIGEQGRAAGLRVSVF